MPNKKALGAIVGILLLIGIVITISTIVFVWGTNFISNLSPPVDCSQVSFEAEIYNDNNYFLNVVNTGDIQIKGIVLKSIKEGEIKIEQDFNIDINIGATESLRLNLLPNKGDKFLVVPKIIARTQKDEDIISICSNNDGYETQFREIQV